MKYFVFLDRTTFDYVTRRENDVDFEDYINMPDHYTVVFEGTKLECKTYTDYELSY